MRSVTAYCAEWHIQRSRAFDDLLVDPLKGRIDISLRGWDGVSLDGGDAGDPGAPLVFCMLAPPASVLEDGGRKVIWIPMWDLVRHKPQRWWNRLSKSMRVVAFSEVVADRSEAAGLATLRLKYYKNPEEFKPVSFAGERTLMYWNRTGMIGPDGLRNLLDALGVQRAFIRDRTDPGVHPGAGLSSAYHLECVAVERIPDSVSFETYKQYLARSHVFLAPRTVEGAGMTFLEAMASGCAVFAYDGPTMNEYIKNGDNGVLFRRLSSRQENFRWALQRLRQRWLSRGFPDVFRHRPELPDDQDWDTFGRLDIVSLGARARHTHQIGYDQWSASLDRYAEFIMDW